MGKSRIAVVSTDGVTVNEHFGKADHFLIYDLDDQMALVEKRSTETLSVGDPGHLFDADKFARISALLEDCSQVYVTNIGDTPAAKLKVLGVEPVIYAGAIADIANR
jgi:predicted Fe-Mo cluster-binding NifX family protein